MSEKAISDSGESLSQPRRTDVDATQLVVSTMEGAILPSIQQEQIPIQSTNHQQSPEVMQSSAASTMVILSFIFSRKKQIC